MNKNDDELMKDINSLIRDEIQEVINDYVDSENLLQDNNGLGFAGKSDDNQFKVNIRKDAVKKILKEYKKIKKSEKSNFGQIKKLALLDKHGNPLT